MSGLRLDHLAFPCADAEATLRFHCEILGATLTWAARTDEQLMMTLTLEGGLTLSLTCGDGVRPLLPVEPGGDVAHVGLMVAGPAERDGWKRHLTEHGVRFTVEDEGPDERLYFTDPNGIVFEIEATWQPPPGSASQAPAIVRAWLDGRAATRR